MKFYKINLNACLLAWIDKKIKWLMCPTENIFVSFFILLLVSIKKKKYINSNTFLRKSCVIFLSSDYEKTSAELHVSLPNETQAVY